MTLISSKIRTVAVAAVALLTTPLWGQALFQDGFESNTSANYDLRVGYYAGTSTNDYTLDWSYDYSALTYNRFASQTATPETLAVPAAPNSVAGTSKGLKITVNKNDNDPGRFALSLYPKTTNFSGDYVLKFDAFLNHASFADSGVGTTEYLTFGLNHSGNAVNWGVLSGAEQREDFATDAVGGDGSDGVWFGFVGDDGAARGFQTWEGQAGQPSRYLDGEAGGIPDRDGNGNPDDDGAEPYLRTQFPASRFEAAGVLGKRWVQVEVSQVGDELTWKIDGRIISRRTNSSPWKSGRVMIGYMDPFAGVSEVKGENWLLIDNVRVETVRKVTVNTADNASPAGDGKTSLAEALNDLRSNDRITFNIPGAGPHYLVTPAAGYPRIQADNVIIDGFTQPGASANTNALQGADTAQIKIVLDSRAGGRLALTEYGDHGFGDSESAILTVVNSRFFNLRGVAVLSATGGDSAEDPFIYGVALVGASTEGRIQGCWFGVDPAKPTAAGVRGGRAAVASFKWDNTITSEGLWVGTDSDGFGDVAEHNLITGQLLAIHLETPFTRVSGNRFNYLPDGSVFDYSKVPGYLGQFSDMEAIENGRGHFMLIGTDGDGINDANERNFVGPLKYDVVAEFWRTATGVVMAGNSFGYGPSGSVLFKNPTPISLAVVRSYSTLRVGSDFSGPDDSNGLEANYLSGMVTPLIRFHGSNATAEQPARVSFRGNVLSGNVGNAPWDASSGLAADKFYGSALAEPTGELRPVIQTNSTVTTLSVRVPARNPSNAIGGIQVDVALADPVGLSATSEEYPNGSVQSLKHLKQVTLDTSFDGGLVDIDLTGIALSAADLKRVTISASYVLNAVAATDATIAVPVAAVTSPFSATLGGFEVPTTPIRVAVTLSGNTLGLSWTGGLPPYSVQVRSALDAPWQNLLTINTLTAPIPVTNAAAFFRVSGN
jgi:hypothetical protein